VAIIIDLSSIIGGHWPKNAASDRRPLAEEFVFSFPLFSLDVPRAAVGGGSAAAAAAAAREKNIRRLFPRRRRRRFLNFRPTRQEFPTRSNVKHKQTARLVRFYSYTLGPSNTVVLGFLVPKFERQPCRPIEDSIPFVPVSTPSLF